MLFLLLSFRATATRVTTYKQLSFDLTHQAGLFTLVCLFVCIFFTNCLNYIPVNKLPELSSVNGVSFHTYLDGSLVTVVC